jgi:hypothetical protein
LPEPLADKYTVIPNDLRTHDPTPLDKTEYFVLKRGDVFAAATLWAYASEIMTTLEVDVTIRATGRPGLTDLERSRLREQAEQVTALATEWRKHTNKLPD